MIDKLINYLPVPLNPNIPAEEDWEIVEKELGLQFPQDFKDMINIYSSGEIGDQLRFVSPKISSTGKRRLLEKILMYSKQDREFIEKFPDNHPEIPFDIYPNTPGLITVCSDSVGNRFCYLTDKTPENWKLVYLFNKSEDYFIYNGSLTDYFVEIYEDTLPQKFQCEYYSDLQNPEYRYFRPQN